MATEKKTFMLTTLCYYPCHIYVDATTKAEAVKILEDKDRWHLAEQEHDIANYQFDTFYVEDLKEFKGRRFKNWKNTLNQSQLTGVYPENREGLDENMPEDDDTLG